MKLFAFILLINFTNLTSSKSLNIIDKAQYFFSHSDPDSDSKLHKITDRKNRERPTDFYNNYMLNGLILVPL